MRKVYNSNALVVRSQSESEEFIKDLGDVIKKLQDLGNEVEIHTQNIPGKFAVLVLGYQKQADYSDY